MPWSESRKRTFSELQDVYAGPEDFMEAGARGFLITTVPDKEELATDQALKMLRKASVKLFGGYKPAKNTTAMFSCGYIAIDFMDPEAVTVLPNPDLKAENAGLKQDQDNVPEKESEEAVKEEVKDANMEEDQSIKTEVDEEKMQTDEKGENKDKESVDESGDKRTEKPVETGKETQEQEKEIQDEDTADQNKKDKKEKEAESSNKDKDSVSKTKESSNKGKQGGDKSKSDTRRSRSGKEEDRRRDHKRKRKQESSTPKWQLMKAIYKFKAFRTELRNILFIKSDIPDPLVLINEIMDLLDKSKPLKADAIYQFLPIQGVCNYSYWELEVMARRVLAPFFQEDQEVAPSFGILMFDKMSDPGADVLAEIVRSAIWSLNPNAWQNHPICQPTIVIHLELIGSKIAMSALPNFMRYRQYSPFFVAELGEGRPEIQDDPDKATDASDKGKDKDKSESRKSEKSRNKSQRSNKDEDSPSGKGKDKDCKDKSSDREKHGRTTSVDDEKKDSKKSEKEKTEEEEEEKKEESAEKPKEEGVETEETKDEEKKTPTRRGGRRATSQKKKN